MSLKLYSVMFRGQDMPTLIEMSDEQFEALRRGEFVLAKKFNTRTREYTDFGFSLSVVQTLQTSDYQNQQGGN